MRFTQPLYKLGRPYNMKLSRIQSDSFITNLEISEKIQGIKMFFLKKTITNCLKFIYD